MNTKDIIQELKAILEQVASPSALDEHAWVDSLHVRQFVEQNPQLQQNSPGLQLLSAINAMFRETMPSTPPKRGKRLDTQWGEFGILGALYFAPFEFGALRPTRLLDAWGRIDDVILQFQFGTQITIVSDRQKQRYCLVGDEIEAAPISTISDWHVRGLERLADAILASEKRLSVKRGEVSVILDPGNAASAQGEKSPQGSRLIPWNRRNARRVWISLALILVLFLGWKGYRTYTLYRAFRVNVDQLQELATNDLSLASLNDIGPLLQSTSRDVVALRDEVAPFRWVGRLLGWLPVYGGDLASAGDLLDMAAGLIVAGDQAYQAGLPLLQVFQSGDTNTSIPAALILLEEAQSDFILAQEAVTQALDARANIEVERLSPKTRPLIEKIDPYLPWLDDGMAAAIAAPKLLGARGYGPQTYLILLQNEDESRPTGGFITAVGVITIENGDLISLSVENSVYLHNPEDFYPPAPEPIDKYMQIPVWFFRDANWRADYPYGALWAETLYAKARGHAADGVIAVTQHFFEILLSATGPIEVTGATELISADNLLAYMRSSKDAAKQEGGEEWLFNRKDFLRPLADALMAKLLHDPDIPWPKLANAVLKGLDEHHVLLQLDDPDITELLRRRGWDGGMRRGEGDFLMVANTNLGWTKSDAAVETQLNYDIDLSDMVSPTAELTVIHNNTAPDHVECIHHYYIGRGSSYQDYVEHCLWNYLRVYVLQGTQLDDATPHVVPPRWMITGKIVLPKVDEVYEYLPGIRTWGTFFVVPVGETVQTRFDYTLPAEEILYRDNKGQWVYSLFVKKQPGTIAVPLTLQIHLPRGSSVIDASHEGNQDGDIWMATIPLRVDHQINLTIADDK